jgi:beta-glucosidase
MRRIERLLTAMTLEEKLGQLNMIPGSRTVTGPGGQRDLEEGISSGRIGSVLNIWGAEQTQALQRVAVEHSRLAVPVLFGLDVIHGHRTIFPVPLAEAGLFAPDAWEESARAAAAEAAQDGIALTFAPMLDVARDPRWGRIVESPGEDPWVASRFAEAKVRGWQGRAPDSPARLGATAKHLCAYGAVTAGREYASVDIAARTVHELYLPPFAAAVSAGVLAIMPALTDLAGVPMTANAALLKAWLRKRLGFDGVIVSDYNAVTDLCRFGVAADHVEAAVLALKAGVDIDMASGAYLQALPLALERQLVTPRDVDACVRRVLRLKERLGLFDDPYQRGSAAAPETLQTRALARAAARRAIVLLTLRRNVLPLDPAIRRIALIGPLAAAGREMLGPWAAAGEPGEAVSVLQGLSDALPGCRIDCLTGVALEGDATHEIAGAVERCREAELVILCLGEGASMSGEAASRAGLGLPGSQRALAEAVLAMGKPVVVVLFSGRPLAVPWLCERADALLAAWFLGSEAGHAVADVLTGKAVPSGKLAVSWPRQLGQVPLYYAQRPSGRPSDETEHYSSRYLDVPFTPQFPFGHGLSYAHFVLESMQCAPAQVRRDDEIEVAVAVHNQADLGGEATVFLFIRDVVARVARPVLELRGVRKLQLGPRERGTVSWRLPVEALAGVGEDLEPLLEPGLFEIHVGQSADPAAFLSSRVELLP